MLSCPTTTYARSDGAPNNSVMLPNFSGLACMQIGVEEEWIGAFIALVMERMPVIASWGFAKTCSGLMCAMYNR
jgi:hypothetical protein